MKIKYKTIAHILSALLFFPIVFPNSFRSFSVFIFTIVGFFMLFVIKRVERYKLLFFSIFALITLAFLTKGIPNSSLEAYQWVFFVYIVSPAIWILIWTFLLRYISVKDIIVRLIDFGIIGCFSTFVLMYFFLTQRASVMTWMIADPNVLIKDGQISIAMHFFGSLIFIGAGIIASPNVIANKFRRTATTLLIILVGLISGRAAIFLSLGFAGVIRILLNRKKIDLSVFMSMFLISIFVPLLAPHILDEKKIDVVLIAREYCVKILDGGGDARKDQFYSLLQGIEESHFLGAGHGVSASVIRSYEMPWKYELLPIATMFHVGIIGFFFYVIPIFLVFLVYRKLNQKNLTTEYDLFIFSGFIGIILASFTNPYLESFDFQWMIIFPCVHFFGRHYEMSNLKIGKS